jgi:CheY-specific phosphatase CheX
LKKVAMSAPLNAAAVNVLLSASVHFLEKPGNVFITKRSLRLMEKMETRRSILVRFALHGQHVGEVSWMFDAPCASRVSAGMLRRAEAPAFGSEMFSDAISEFANIIAGNCVESFAGLGYTVNVSPPKSVLMETPTLLEFPSRHLVIELSSGEGTTWVLLNPPPPEGTAF